MFDVINQGLIAKNPWMVKDKKPNSDLNVNSRCTSSSTHLLDNIDTKPRIPDDLSYGPGFVQKLRDRYIKLFVDFSNTNCEKSQNLNQRYLLQSKNKQCQQRPKNIYNRRALSCDELTMENCNCNIGSNASSKINDIEAESENRKPKSFCSSSEHLSKDAQQPNNTTIVKPSQPISTLKQQFELLHKDSANTQRKHVFVAKSQSSDHWKTKVSINDQSLPEFVRVAKKLKHVPVEQSTSVNGSHVLLSSDHLDKNAQNGTKILKTKAVVSDLNLQNHSKPMPAVRNSLSSKLRQKTVSEGADPQSGFYTIATYDKIPHSPIGDFADNCGGEGSSDDDANIFGNEKRRFEFIGSSIILEKSNIWSGGRQKNGLDFDPNYPNVYAYVDEIEAEEWLPGIKLHYVDYKTLCIKLKKERLTQLQKRNELNISDQNSSASSKNDITKFEPSIVKNFNTDDLLTCRSEFLRNTSNDHNYVVGTTMKDDDVTMSPEVAASSVDKYFSKNDQSSDLLF